MSKKPIDFMSMNAMVLTVSDTRTSADDSSGDYLSEALEKGGHKVIDRSLCKDDVYEIRAHLSRAIADPGIRVVLVTGGTGFFPGDVTPEAVKPLFDKEIEGFGEMFRLISRDEIGMSTIQSRAIAGVANRTLIFCLPGSGNACRTAWERIIQPQLDPRMERCGFTRVALRWTEDEERDDRHRAAKPSH